MDEMARTRSRTIHFSGRRYRAIWREKLFKEAGTSNWKDVVNTRRCLKAAARWMILEAVLHQFSLARDEDQERERRDTERGDPVRG